MRTLTAKFDVTGLTEAEIDALVLAIAVQAESDGAYPSVPDPVIEVEPAQAPQADQVSARLAEMLSDRQAAVATPTSVPAVAVSMDGTTNFGGVGRGSTGRLRNFRAMNDAKLMNVIDQLFNETTLDQEAIDAALAAKTERGL